MSEPTSNARGAAFWNSTMGHAWVSQQAVISSVFTSVTNVSVGAAAPKPGEHVVDIGCGTGDTLLAFARAVGASGAALGVDVSVPMLDLARHRATEEGLGNVTCALADATDLRVSLPRSADLVYSRFGVMFFDDPVKAFANIRSGMKPGGRLVFVCFRTMPESPWFRVPIEAARPHVPPQPPADPLTPGMFSLASEERLRGILSDAGFRAISLKATDVPIDGKDITQSMAFLSQAGPVARPRCERFGRAATARHRGGARCGRRWYRSRRTWTSCGSAAGVGAGVIDSVGQRRRSVPNRTDLDYFGQ